MPDVQLQQYDWRGYFADDSLSLTEVPGKSFGVAGDPMPYNLQSDDVITSLLFCCFILAVYAFSSVRGFLARQAKHLFYTSHEEQAEMTETAGEVHFQLLLVLLTSLFIALLYYLYTLQVHGETFILDSPYQLIAIYLGIVLGYFLMKLLLYSVVNRTFFDSKRNKHYMAVLLFLITIEGVLFFPAVLVQGYMHLSVQNVETYVTIVLIFVKSLTLYKCYTIFFRQNVVRLQIFLYLCALEIIPLFMLLGVLGLTATSLKINY